MGWNGVKLDRGQLPEGYVLKMLGDCKPKAMATVGEALYLAVPCNEDSPHGLYKRGDVVGLVVLMRKEADGYTYFKWIDEFCGPAADEAPTKVLRALSPLPKSDNPMVRLAKEWRKRCRENAGGRLTVEALAKAFG
jgi:hypothetical protein